MARVASGGVVADAALADIRFEECFRVWDPRVSADAWGRETGLMLMEGAVLVVEDH